jgi:diguanylate cyclase (GGDEF)-like protein
VDGAIYLVEQYKGEDSLLLKTHLNKDGLRNEEIPKIDHDFEFSTNQYTLEVHDISDDNPVSSVTISLNNLNNEVIGVVRLQNKKLANVKTNFTKKELNTVELIVSQLSMTLDRIQTYVKLQRNVLLTRTTFISFLNGMKQAMSTIGDDILDEQEKFKQYATLDPLTGFLTRNEGLAFLEKQLEFARFNGVNVVLCFIDINGLKQVNDSFGHAEGDIMLETFAKTVKSTARENDLIFRYGGDEFILVLYDVDKKTAEKVWGRINNQLHKVNLELEKPYEINAAVGYAEYNYLEKQTINELIDIADKEMYINKNKMKAIE